MTIFSSKYNNNYKKKKKTILIFVRINVIFYDEDHLVTHKSSKAQDKNKGWLGVACLGVHQTINGTTRWWWWW